MASRRPPVPRGSRGGPSRPNSGGARPGPGASRPPGNSSRGRASRSSNSAEAPIIEREEQKRPPRLFTIRFVMLFVIAVFALVTLIPTVRAYLVQRSEIAQLEQEVEAAEQREKDLRAELARWEDPAYVAAQARERLAFVMPGETAYRVIDPDFVEPEDPELAEDSVEAGLPALEDLVDVSDDQPWFSSIRDSIRVAGEN